LNSSYHFAKDLNSIRSHTIMFSISDQWYELNLVLPTKVKNIDPVWQVYTNIPWSLGPVPGFIYGTTYINKSYWDGKTAKSCIHFWWRNKMRNVWQIKFCGQRRNAQRATRHIRVSNRLKKWSRLSHFTLQTRAC